MRYKTKQSGQSLILFLGFTAALVGAFLVVFNVGQTTNAKMRAMNAADAAAYSGALWEARTLNLQAYLNRAMVANEVAIAQSVSLRSWVDYLQRFVNNVNDITEFIPELGEATIAVADILTEANTAIEESLPYAEGVLRVASNITFDAQVAVNDLGSVVAQNLASSVATSNGTRLSTAGEALIGLNTEKWLRFTSSYSKSTGVVGTDGRTRLRAVALDSRDGFSYARNWNRGFVPIFDMRKQGGTDLLNFESWKGLDSVQLDTVYIPIKGWTVKVPLGWGGAQAYSTRLMTGYGTHGGPGNNWRSIDGELAVTASDRSPNASSISNKVGSAESAFPNYRDIANMDQRPAPQRVADVHLPFAVEVLIDKTKVNTSETALKHANTVLPNGTVIDHHANFASGDSGVFALSEACVRFSRPYGATRTGGLEYPSLFNPYWRASLATIDKATRLFADTFKGLPEAALLEGAGTCA